MNDIKRKADSGTLGIRIFGSLFLFLAVLFQVYGEGAHESGRGVLFTDITEKEWMLSEVSAGGIAGGKTVIMDRKKLEADNLGGVYSLTFKEGLVSGMGAPNRYNAPYTEQAGKILGIGKVASTMMFAFKEPDGLREKEYFSLLEKVTRWDLREGKLVLYSSDSTGTEAVMRFTRN